MTKNCNFNFLRLFPTSNSLPTNHCYHSSTVEPSTVPRQQQQITVFCNGRVFFCDMTEIQARAIILYATQEMQGRIGRKGSNLSNVSLYRPPPPGLSVKRSLQRFLQKRKQRTQALSPYNNH